MYALRSNKVIEIEKIIKPSKRRTGFWCKLKNIKKTKLISAKNIFESKEEAEIYL